MDKKAFKQGFIDGIPIGLGYFAVAFSLGITAKEAGLNWFQGFLATGSTLASAGAYAGFVAIAEKATYIEMAIIILVANCRYMLMSCALSQKISKDTRFVHRPLVAFFITDELFAINIARPGYLSPSYAYGSFFAAGPLWATGTAIGIVAGNVLPTSVVSALSVALYGMFLAIIIPPIKKQAIIGALVAISFALSYAARYIPLVKELNSSVKTVVLTVLIAGSAAILFPVPDEEEGEADAA